MKYEFMVEATQNEFMSLKTYEKELVEQVKKAFNEANRQKYKDMEARIKYNNDRKEIGIFVKTANGEKLVLDFDDNMTNENEKAFAYSLSREIKEKLGRIRMPSEKWVESI